MAYFEELAPGSVTVTEVDCLGECGLGPNVKLEPENVVVNGCKSKAAVAQILEERCVDGTGLMARILEE
eukprot:CAMPEP_0114256652 /NCGR_PEP_ID=MMETSP0058-20121206/18287_1 /TAXON_ID=36894 /ORGANISM="Pyramimonas parkeae, CCMP726" /LENGTH=68 /DNA_ID=CAMNT_0001371273 /DNA_START=220 /DNA_END=426 /DNA_ORIENTATION=+